MKLPHADRAFVPPRKLVGYLLAHQHPDGASKARFFASVGFTPERAALLTVALLGLARTGDVVEVESSAYGDQVRRRRNDSLADRTEDLFTDRLDH